MLPQLTTKGTFGCHSRHGHQRALLSFHKCHGSSCLGVGFVLFRLARRATNEFRQPLILLGVYKAPVLPCTPPSLALFFEKVYKPKGKWESQRLGTKTIGARFIPVFKGQPQGKASPKQDGGELTGNLFLSPGPLSLEKGP